MTTFSTASAPRDGDPFAALGGCTVLDCRVRVVRTGGWSWGPDPAALPRGVTALLPGVVAAHLTGRFAVPRPPDPDGPAAGSPPRPPDREVTEPVHIRSTVTLAELLRASTGPTVSTETPAACEVGPPGTDLPGVGGRPTATTVEGIPGARAREEDGDGPDPGERLDRPHLLDRELVGLLAEAAVCGTLDAVLSGLPSDTLRLLVRALDAAGSRTAAVAATAPGEPPPAEEAVAGEAAGRRAGSADLTAAVLAALRRTSSDGRQVTDTDPGTGQDPEPEREQGSGPAAVPAAPRSPERSGPGPVRVVPGTVTDVEHALPFLLLPPLHDRGWPAALAAVLAGGGAPDEDGPALAAALARKVLPPPAHGRLRRPAEDHSVTVFAGMTGTSAGDLSVENLERRVGPLLPLLDARLGLQTARGHARDSPVLLHAVTPERLLLLDVDGLYPMAQARRAEDLLRPWELAGRPLVLLPARAGGLTSALDSLGIRFVTDAPPVRGERLSRVPGPCRCWTNSPSDGRDPGLARRLGHESGRAARFVGELVELRPVDPTGRARAVECGTTLAAGVALADLAWKLWSGRETPDPVHALGRFADLGARVLVHDHAVEVRLPLGPRHADLYRHRLLADVPDVPWFGGRTVVFTGG